MNAPGNDEPADEELTPHRAVSPRLVVVGVLVVLALVVVAVVAVTTRRDDDDAAPAPSPRSSASPTLSIPANPTSVPEQDAITALNRCGGDCVTYGLSQTVLGRTGMHGLVATFGLRVTDGQHEQLRSINGRADGADVRLLYERVALPDAALRVTDSMGPNRTVVLAVIRGGWRLTAVLIGATPPTAAASRWARSAPLPR